MIEYNYHPQKACRQQSHFTLTRKTLFFFSSAKNLVSEIRSETKEKLVYVSTNEIVQANIEILARQGYKVTQICHNLTPTYIDHTDHTIVLKS